MTQPQFANRASLRAARQQDRAGYLFTLGDGTVAHVRKLSLADSATFAGLPSRLSQEVLEVFNDVQGEKAAGVLTMERLRQNQERQERLANLICVAGFLRPRLVLHEDDLADEDDDAALVTDIDIADRIRFLQHALSTDNEVVRSFRPVAGATMGTVRPLPVGETTAATERPSRNELTYRERYT